MNMKGSALSSPKTVNNALSAYISCVKRTALFLLKIVDRGQVGHETHTAGAPVHPVLIARRD